jgi:hypothetical protein
LQPKDDGITGRMIQRQRSRSVDTSVDFAPEHACDKVGTRWKATIQRPHPNSGLGRDLSHGRVDAGRSEHLLCSFENGVFVSACVGTYWAPGDCAAFDYRSDQRTFQTRH